MEESVVISDNINQEETKEEIPKKAPEMTVEDTDAKSDKNLK